FAWLGLVALGGIVTAGLTGMAGLRSASGMFSALGNVGPCYISQAELGALPAAVKAVYIVGMLAGRLEIIPVLLFFIPRSWRS
ncbi:MAG TPA: TrkH family potassium uptake protein, partial [bacterium]|nr:TrkH family potassium uptake protein [bacterium]